MRKLIDEHVISLGVDPSIAPISLLDADFELHVQRQTSTRAMASEMEHAIRSHIRKHMDEDPVLYRKLSERLNLLLQAMANQWQAQIAAMQQLFDELRSGHINNEDLPADLPEHYLPFLHELLATVLGEQQPDAAQLQKLRDLTVELVDMIADEMSDSFWEPHKRAAQDALGTRIFKALHASRLLALPQSQALKDRLLQRAKANQDKLRKAGS